MKGRARQNSKAYDPETELRPLVLLALQGDQAAYADFLDRVSEMLRAYIRKSNSQLSTEQIEDLVQDVLLSIHRKRHTYRPDLPIAPWLFAIARYRLIDSYRYESRRPAIDAFFQDLDSIQCSSETAELKQNDLTKILSPLSERQREVLQLAKIDEMSLAEVGEKLQMSLSAVKVTIHRAMATLRRSQSIAETSNED